ncbi:hypothetical protein DLJ53_31110 [Acuticoccus sediminis]|uniref:Uncharacterized protein n=1 Tax=Acuticoccus sediminis TaxID=2184697 RepID=A0A8B2NG11_9HYPH|nr:hypothetical protein DLJ53_31110 [Acuticoccus sediminis]
MRIMEPVYGYDPLRRHSERNRCVQVIAAMVFGTQTIAPVGMLAGPGNACVRKALTRLTRSTNEVNTSKNAR